MVSNRANAGFANRTRSTRTCSPSWGNGPTAKIRFDPFATYDEYAKAGEMMVESIAGYQIAD